MRRIRFAGYEHQSREQNATDIHAHSEFGTITDFGNGVVVMRVVKAKDRPFVEIIGEDGLNEFGEKFCYGDYFLLAEVP
jgi:hypothetical protein